MKDIRSEIKDAADDDVWATLACPLCNKLFANDDKPMGTYAMGSIGHIECIENKYWPDTLNESSAPKNAADQPKGRPVPWGKRFPNKDDEEA